MKYFVFDFSKNIRSLREFSDGGGGGLSERREERGEITGKRSERVREREKKKKRERRIEVSYIFLVESRRKERNHATKV